MKDIDGLSPILWGMFYGSKEHVETLILSGSDVKFVDKKGHSLFHYLALNKEISLENLDTYLEILTAHGGDINFKRKTPSPLFMLVNEMSFSKNITKKEDKKVEIFLAHGADLSLAIQEGKELSLNIGKMSYLKYKRGDF